MVAFRRDSLKMSTRVRVPAYFLLGRLLCRVGERYLHGSLTVFSDLVKRCTVFRFPVSRLCNFFMALFDSVDRLLCPRGWGTADSRSLDRLTYPPVCTSSLWRSVRSCTDSTKMSTRLFKPMCGWLGRDRDLGQSWHGRDGSGRSLLRMVVRDLLRPGSQLDYDSESRVNPDSASLHRRDVCSLDLGLSMPPITDLHNPFPLFASRHGHGLLNRRY